MTDEQRDLELVALTRLGLASALGLPSSHPGDLVGELTRTGLLTEIQAVAVKAYVAQFSVLCPCGRRSLAPENANAFRCSACGISLSRRASGGGSWAKAPQAPAPGVGTKIGPLELLGILGKGASGTVFLARHAQLGRHSAVKVVPAAALDKNRRTRFDRELEALGRLNHPGIVKLHAAFEHEGSLVYEMDLVEGETLEDVFRRGPLPWREAATLVARIADAVEHAHRAGVLHRDLKPANVLVRGEDGTPLVADFGLARLSDQTSSLTRAGTWVGTPAYMAPEALSGNTTEVSDVYGIGAILYEALAGRAPFQEDSPHALFYKVTNGKCDPTGARGAPADLERVRARAMAPDPAQRYRSAGELAADLRRLVAGERVGLPRRWTFVALCILVVALLLALALRALTPEPLPPSPPVLAPITTLEGALEALARSEADPARRSASLRLVARAGDAVSVAALSSVVSAAPGDKEVRRLRWLACRRNVVSLEASDLIALAEWSATEPGELETIASYAVSHGLEGADLGAIRALHLRHPTRAFAALHGFLACASGDPSLRAEAAEALQAGKPLEEPAQRLARAIAATDAFLDLLEPGRPDARVAAEGVARDLGMAAAIAPRSVPVILFPLEKVARKALGSGLLTDATHPAPAQALLVVLASVTGSLPPVLEAIDEVVRDLASLVSESITVAVRSPEKLARSGEALATSDPHLAGGALECAALRARTARKPGEDPKAIVEWYERARSLIRGAPATTDFDMSWSRFVLRRCSNGLSELEQYLAAETPEASRAHLERALEYTRESIVVDRDNQGLGRSLEVDTGTAVKLLYRLDRIAEAAEIGSHLPQGEALAVEVVRRSGDARRAVALGRVALERASHSARTDSLGVLMLSLADLGEGAAAWGMMSDLQASERAEGALLEDFSSAAVRRHLTRKAPR